MQQRLRRDDERQRAQEGGHGRAVLAAPERDRAQRRPHAAQQPRRRDRARGRGLRLRLRAQTKNARRVTCTTYVTK